MAHANFLLGNYVRIVVKSTQRPSSNTCCSISIYAPLHYSHTRTTLYICQAYTRNFILFLKVWMSLPLHGKKWLTTPSRLSSALSQRPPLICKIKDTSSTSLDLAPSEILNGCLSFHKYTTLIIPISASYYS